MLDRHLRRTRRPATFRRAPQSRAWPTANERICSAAPGVLALLALLLVLPATGYADRAGRKRESLDLAERHALQRLFAEDESAKALYERSYGHAVFDVVKVSLLVTGGGGQGVAVNKSTGERTYMNMGTGGLNLGLGGKAYAIVFLFQTQQKFDAFVGNGWQGGVSADATAGRATADAGANFHNGIAYYQLTDAGLMLQADITGTKYWKSDRLN